MSSEPQFAGLATKIIWDKTTGTLVSQDPGTKRNQMVLFEEGGTRIVPTDPAREFLNQPDAPRLIQALAEIGQQDETFFNRAQEIEGRITAGPRLGYWTITGIQTRAIGPARPADPESVAKPLNESEVIEEQVETVQRIEDEV